MSNNAINGNAINEASFPGAETGLSLVQLVGTVEVTCSIQSVSLRLTAFATTEAKAHGTFSTSKRTLFSCETAGSALASASALVKRPNGAASSAVAMTSSFACLKYIFSAATPGAALVPSVNGYIAAARGATVNCHAMTLPAEANTLVSRGVVVAPTAITSAVALRKVPSLATGSAFASAVAGMSFKNRLAAFTEAKVMPSASTRFNVRVGSSAKPEAVVYAGSRKNINLALMPQAVSATSSVIAPIQLLKFSAAAQANALASATIRVKYSLSGFTVASAIAQSAASDFASAMPAPAERLMKVPASNRRMEVTE